jgi:carboxypeptidase family protein
MKKKRKSESCESRRSLRPFFSRSFTLYVMSLVCLLAVAAPAFAGKKKEKPPRTVLGVVLDGSENPIVGAVVEMTDVQTGKKSVLYTQNGGHYEFAGLDQNHDYKVQATFNGVASQTRTASSFDTRNTIRLNFQIPPPKDEQAGEK